MSTWPFSVGPERGATRPIDGRCKKVCERENSWGRTHLVDEGQGELQRQLEHLKAHTSADEPLWVMLLLSAYSKYSRTQRNNYGTFTSNL